MASKGVNRSENLIRRTRKLIDGYPKNSILKEFLQNADDAKATELIVIYDARIHTALDDTDFLPAKGPALLICNNSKFQETDFNAIVEIGFENEDEDDKQHDPNTTGRFGEGFNSSFSISDHPSFISNGRVYWFDILREAVSKDRNIPDTRYWELEEEEDFKEIEKLLNVFYRDSECYFNSDNTVFRLPLRDSKNTSRISNEVFSIEDFLEWVDEWKNNASQLLFLRNIQKLVLKEIDINGKVTVHLKIDTTNDVEILKINNMIQKEFNEKPLNICKRWKDSDDDLPYFKYKHQFSIEYFERKKESTYKELENWVVVNGLFRGGNNSLINQAIEALEIKSEPRKVMPWVGVAIQLDNEGKPQKTINSKYFTFLPLPIKSNYPIHIHAWFEINSERTQIISTEDGTDLKKLTKWNKLLLQEGVAKAWALLIDYLKTDKTSYYSFWAKDTEFALNEELIKGFYQSISELNCLYTIYKQEKSWQSPKEKNLYYFKDEKNQILLDAFKEYFPIIYPKPPKFIIENFKEVGVELIEITSEFIREYLKEKSKDINFPVSIEKIPITMLQRKEWLIEIIKYCADNGDDYSLLDDLPIELTLDENIYIVGAKTLVDENPNLKLFQNMKQLYIDLDIVNSIENSDNLPSSWLEPTLKNQIELLISYWKQLDITKEWLEEVVHVIINSTEEEFSEAEDIIKELQLVYQENNEYGKLESDIDEYSPFMPSDEDIENNLIYLDEISMNVVHHKYVEIYKPLLKYEGLITQLTSETLIEHLLLLDSFEFFKKQEIREYLVDILTEDISWFDELSNYQIKKLYSMPFIETVANNIYSKETDTKLFLPTNFTPPKDIKSLEGEYEVIAVERKTKLYKLYLKMDLTEQNINSYIQEIIIPFLENSDSFEDKKEVLKWLSIEWDDIKNDIEEEILEELKESSIIPSLVNEQELYKASELYIPTVELGKIFTDGLYMPISFSDEEVQIKWIELLSDLGSSKNILPQHIISKIEKIIEEGNQSLAIDLLNFMANKFEVFEEMQFGNTSILEVLQEYAWLPVERANDILKSRTEYSKLKKADELILYDDRKIGGGYYHILSRSVNLGKKDDRGEYSEKEMAEKLGIVTNIPKEHFFESFRELMKLSPTNGQVLNYVKEVYKYIGRRFKGERVDFDIEERTILIDNQWIAPKYVYQYKINLTGIKSWNSLIKEDSESDLAKGLISLGVQEKPTFDFFIEQLQLLPQEQDLNQNQIRDAKVLLHEIQNEEDLLGLPILTPYNQLVLSSKLYINDFPAYKKASDKNENLYFCQTQFERLAKRLNVLTLSENYISKVDSIKESNNGHSIINILERDSFKEGILRLLYHEKKIQEDEINESLLEEILPSRIIFVSQLVIKYSIEDKFLFRSDETTYEKDGELYILEQDDEDDMIEIISKYICDNQKLSGDNRSWIERILRKQMNREEIHDFLDKKKVIELPQKFDIEEELSLFSDSNVSESNSEIIYDSSTSQEENYPQENSKSKGEIAPPTQPKTSSKEEKSDRENSSSSSSSKQGKRINNFEGNSSNKSDKKIVSSNDRKPVYVEKNREVNEEQQKSQRESAKKIGDKGENHILDNKNSLLLSSINYFEKAPTNNKGFDIYEKDQTGQTIRYIEVKTLTGQWGEGGVGITEHQLEFAQKQKDKWWLFVVEGINTENPKVYQFKNPVVEANRFMFDSSWKQLAYQKESISDNKPKVGNKYEIEIEGIIKTCIVTNVKPRGALYQVDLILENGKEIKKKKFKKSWRKIDG